MADWRPHRKRSIGPEREAQGDSAPADTGLSVWLYLPLVPSLALAGSSVRRVPKAELHKPLPPLFLLPNPYPKFKSHLHHIGTKSRMLMARGSLMNIILRVLEFHGGTQGWES